MLIAAEDDDFANLISGRAPCDFRLPDSPLAPADVLEMLRSLAATVRNDFAPSGWMIVEDGEIVGLCSVVRPPTDSVLEIGYGVAPTRQRRGITKRAIAELLRWAKSDYRIDAVTAETSVDNVASQIVLSSNGFVQTGKRVDLEDGEVLCWKAPILR
jgi:RimJ/RimL family protein N-acetyltransferase